MDKIDLEEGKKLDLQFAKRGGLLPVVVQNIADGAVLMLAWANEEAVQYTIKHGVAAFYSTSRNSLWVKGETSGNRLHLEEILVDCDQDALLYRVRLEGDGACHTLRCDGRPRYSCFYRKIDTSSSDLAFLTAHDAASNRGAAE